jgi:hypothetical protein
VFRLFAKNGRYENIIHLQEEKVLVVEGRDGTLIPEQEDFICTEIKIRAVIAQSV